MVRPFIIKVSVFGYFPLYHSLRIHVLHHIYIYIYIYIYIPYMESYEVQLMKLLNTSRPRSVLTVIAHCMEYQTILQYLLPI